MPIPRLKLEGTDDIWLYYLGGPHIQWGDFLIVDEQDHVTISDALRGGVALTDALRGNVVIGDTDNG
jgi:hypothetical protein